VPVRSPVIPVEQAHRHVRSVDAHGITGNVYTERQTIQRKPWNAVPPDYGVREDKHDDLWDLDICHTLGLSMCARAQ
jgi:hypothetical protein